MIFNIYCTKNVKFSIYIWMLKIFYVTFGYYLIFN